METTDVHANLRAYDYHTNRPAPGYGLSRIATLIRRARGEAANTLLFDNGDFLQGTPLSDITARHDNGWRGTHPVIAAMNGLGYDAGTLGNHEFNFGLDWLRDALSGAAFPLTCANALVCPGTANPGRDNTLLPPYLLLPRTVTDDTGTPRRLTIGVLGLVPPQIITWDQYHLACRLWTRDMVEAARHTLPRLRAAGADLVIVLAHTGIEPGPHVTGMENAALPLAALPGVDAVLAGHSHQVFPSTGFARVEGADPQAGTLHGTPAVMAGFRGSHLGVVDLSLTCRAGRWQVIASHSEARAALDTPPDPALDRIVAAAHRATIGLTRQPLGESRRNLHSYLALAGQSGAVQLVAQAQCAALCLRLKDQLDPEVPVLSASTAFKSGGRGGPEHFTDVPAGPVFLRHAADLYPFPNLLCALPLTGAGLRAWLERAAIVFNTIRPGKAEQPLLDPRVPTHAFDVIHGVTYRIDLAHPPLYAPDGALLGQGAGRIRDLRHQGRPVVDSDRFVIATNTYRAFGGGHYPPTPPGTILHAGQTPIVDHLAAHIESASPLPACAPPIWRFSPMPGTSVLFDTGPGLRAYPHDIAALGAHDMGDTDAGFARLSLPL